MELIGFAVFAAIFVVLAVTLFGGLIWAALSDGRDAQARSSLRLRVSA